MKRGILVKLLPVLIAALLVVPMVLGGCAKEPSQPEPSQPKPAILIGILNDLSGPAAAPGSSFQAGMEDYLAYVNAQGGVQGHPVKAITVDTRFEVPLSLQGYQKLVKQDKVSAIIVLASVAAMVNKDNMNDDKIPTIMGFDMPTLLPFEGNYIFAGIPHNSQLAAVGLQWIKENWKEGQPPRIGIHHWGASSGVQFRNGIIFWMEQMDMGEPVVVTSAKMGAVDYTTQISTLKEADLDYLFSYDISLGLFKDIARLGLKDQTIVLDTAALPNEGVPEALGDDGKGIYSISQYATWSEEDVKGVKTMREMNAESHPDVTRRGDWYVLGWTGTSTLIQAFEAVLKEGGYENLTGEAIKNIMETKEFDMMGICSPVKHTPTNHLILDIKARVLKHEGMGTFTPVTDWMQVPDWEAEQLTLEWWKK